MKETQFEDLKTKLESAFGQAQSVIEYIEADPKLRELFVYPDALLHTIAGAKINSTLFEVLESEAEKLAARDWFILHSPLPLFTCDNPVWAFNKPENSSLLEASFHVPLSRNRLLYVTQKLGTGMVAIHEGGLTKDQALMFNQAMVEFCYEEAYAHKKDALSLTVKMEEYCQAQREVPHLP